ncbi:MAG TPA: PIN domain-containing protein [Thermodesulfobacteriota bacterium]
MDPSTLDAIPPGTSVFIDSTIFVYSFAGESAHCLDFLERCERRDLDGITSVVVLVEVAHRLMMLEAVLKGLVARGNVARKLRERPDIVTMLSAYREHLEQIPAMNIEVLALEPSDVARASELRTRYGLLVNDSLILDAALRRGVDVLATADRDFERVTELRLFRPGDLDA